MSARSGGKAERLPRGPHNLEAEDVAENQRVRLVDALVELIGTNGYTATSVANVLHQAGISRRSFYELFANREDLLKTAFEMSAAAVLAEVKVATQRTSAGSRPLEALMHTLCASAEQQPGLISLWSVEIAAADTEGFALREGLMDRYAELLASCLSENGDVPLPHELLLTLAGALQRTIAARVLAAGPEPTRELPQQLTRWMRAYQPAASMLQIAPAKPRPTAEQHELGGGRAPGTLSLSPAGYVPRIGRSSSGFRAHAHRERILDAVAQLNYERGYAGVSAEAIVERTELTQHLFGTQFNNSDEAFIAALELGHMKAQAVVERTVRTAPSWSAGVREALRGLLEFLASEPYFTRMAFVDGPRARPVTARRTNEHIAAYATLLFDQAPARRKPPAVAGEAAMHGIAEIAYRYASRKRLAELQSDLPVAVYLALAPFLGAKQAAELAAE